MTLWILDTDHISLFETGHPLVIQKIQTAEPTNLAVTIVSLCKIYDSKPASI